MLNRRSLLASAGGLLLAGCAARATTVPATVPPSGGSSGDPASVGPAPSWTGAALSGTAGSAPTDITRSTAKPVAHWWQAGEQVMTGDMTIGVCADAYGGIASVQFYGDCATTTVNSATVVTDTDAAGNPRVRLGYWIKLSHSAFTAVSANGKVNIFAKIIANDGTMNPRIIGYDTVNSGGLTRSDWQMTLYPRAAYDFDKTIGSGGDYADLTSFINAARTANATSPRGTFITSGFYEATDGTSGTSGTANAKGLMLITARSGVTATIGRASAFDPNGSDAVGSWKWRPGWHGIEFRGVTFDMANWSSMISNRPCRFNGCKITNSAVNSSNYLWSWNKGPRPQFRVINDTGGIAANGLNCGWVEDCTIEYVTNFAAFMYMATGVKARYIDGSPFDDTDFIANLYLTNCDVSPSTNAHTGITITGPAGSTVTINGDGQSVTATSLICKVNGATVATFTFTDHPGGVTSTVSYQMTDLVTKLAAIPGGGWSGTVVDNGMGTRFVQPLANVSASAGVNVQVRHDNHTEIYHSNSGGNTRENIHITRGIARRSYWSSEAINLEGAVRDVMIDNFTVEDAIQQGQIVIVGSNVNFIHCHIDEFLATQPGNPSDKYSHVSNCIALAHDNTGGSSTSYPAYPAWNGNLFDQHVTGLPTGLNDGLLALNFSLGTWGDRTGPDATWTNKANGDDRPAGAALLHKVAPTSKYDRLYNVRASVDAPGALAAGLSNSPTYLF